MRSCRLQRNFCPILNTERSKLGVLPRIRVVSGDKRSLCGVANIFFSSTPARTHTVHTRVCFLNIVYVRHGAPTHDPKTGRSTLYRQSQQGTPGRTNISCPTLALLPAPRGLPSLSSASPHPFPAVPTDIQTSLCPNLGFPQVDSPNTHLVRRTFSRSPASQRSDS